jgi:ABC-type bacteriocin/lantibiotic exporter with double-glycine peptidase domain
MLCTNLELGSESRIDESYQTLGSGTSGMGGVRWEESQYHCLFGTVDTSNFKQSRAMCGPACMKIVLSYFGVHVSEKQMAKVSRASPMSWTKGTNLVTAANRFGFRGEIIDNCNFRIIEKWLRLGVPVIVDWMSTVASGPGRSEMACGHYSVVCGLNKHCIVLQDPGIGRRRHISRQRFLRVWFDFNRVSPKD